jgi:hypothetical protein
MDPKELFVSALKRLNKEQENKRSPPNKADRQIKESSSKQVRQSGTVNVKKAKQSPLHVMVALGGEEIQLLLVLDLGTR